MKKKIVSMSFVFAIVSCSLLLACNQETAFSYTHDINLSGQTDIPPDDEETVEAGGFEFFFPNVGSTLMGIRFLPIPEIINSLRELLGNKKKSKIANIENNETLIDKENKRMAAFMKHDDGSGERIELAYILEGVNRDIAVQLLTGNLFTGNVTSKVIIRKQFPDGRIITLAHSAETEKIAAAKLKSLHQSSIDDSISEGSQAKAFIKVNKVRKAKRINKDGQLQDIVLTSGRGKVRIRNAVVTIEQAQTLNREDGSTTKSQVQSVNSIAPLIILAFDFNNCPTISDSSVVSKIEELGGVIEDLGIINP